MKRTTGIYGILLAGSLVLSACGEASPGSSSDTAPPESTTTPSATPSPTATEAKSYTNEELTALVASLKDIDDRLLTVVPAAQLDQAVAAAKELVATAKITPEACSVFASESMQVPDGSTYAAGSSLSAAEKTQTTITVIAVKDPTIFTDQLTSSQDAVDQCPAYKIEKDGETISSKIKPLEVKTDGEMSFGALTTQSLPTGEKQTVMSVSGVQGTLGVTAVKVGAKVTTEAQTELEQLINDVLAKG